MTDTIQAAQSPEVFDVLSFVQQTAYPTERVVLFQNAKAADEYVKLVAKRSEQEKDKSLKDAEDLTPRIEELGETIRESSIVFDLRGMPPGMVQEILSKEEESEIEKDNELIANTIVKVSNHKGAVDSRLWDATMVATLRTYLKEGEFRKLIVAVGNVNLNAAVFDQATDAGFSGGSSDLAE